MDPQLRYRFSSVLGASVLTVVSVWISNLPEVQDLLTVHIPVFNRLQSHVLHGGDLTLVTLTTLAVMLVIMVPLFKPTPKRRLESILETQKRVVIGSLGLATIGFYNYTYSIPRPTLILITVFLLVSLPILIVYLRERPGDQGSAVLIGNDPESMRDILESSDTDVYTGYISPTRIQSLGLDSSPARYTDGGVVKHRNDEEFDLPWLGSFARTEEILKNYNIDTAVLAFEETGRSDFFGVLSTCYDCGVDVKAHWEHIDHVLIDPSYSGEADIVDIELEPLDPQDYVLKRLFDLAFAATALAVLSPIILVISVAIKLDSKGPVLYKQERTSEFGDTFNIYKFRSMVTDAEKETGVKLSEEDMGDIDPRVTRVGHILRKTHLDEIPQLWSILTGQMSVVGPRPERPELDREIEEGVVKWSKRWFVKPGLTGIAQINDATGHEPEEKLMYDLQYIRDQSIWLDIKIVIRQIWKVVKDVAGFVSGKR